MELETIIRVISLSNHFHSTIHIIIQRNLLLIGNKLRDLNAKIFSFLWTRTLNFFNVLIFDFDESRFHFLLFFFSSSSFLILYFSLAISSSALLSLLTLKYFFSLMLFHLLKLDFLLLCLLVNPFLKNIIQRTIFLHHLKR